MSSPHSVYVSKFTLLHTSLAYISPEVEAMDYVIRNAHLHSISGKRALPREILLLIRECLLPTITTHLIKRSTLALMSYEKSLRDLLCPDCISYNFDIYGPDIWQWEQFTGACACVEPVESSHLAGSRNSIGRAKQGFPTLQEKPISGPGILNPKQFVDASHWLECHLSREATLRLNPRGVDDPSPSGSRSEPATDSIIWKVASSMLEEYSCEPVRRRDDIIRSPNRLIRRQFNPQRDFVQIIPSRHMLTQLQHASQEERDWQAQVTLRRTVKEMGLMVDHSHEFDAYGSHLTPPSYLLRWPITSNKNQDMVEMWKLLFRFLLSLALACLSVPFTFATVAVTILCFYSRPTGYRIF